MKKAFLALLALLSQGAMAGVINFEVQFTPFVGDIAKSQVQTVPGKAYVFLNNVPIAEQDVEKKSVPVIFDNREIAAAVWVPAKSLGGLVRKGKNTLRIEFVPADANASYQSRLQWNEVTDQVKEQRSGGAVSSTNRGGEGMETKKSQGKAVFERDFTGDFATEMPWHKYPAVNALNDEDKQKLAALVKDRAEAFKPNFDAVYKILATRPEIQVAEIRKIGCLEKAHAAGVRVPVPGAADLEFATTGSSAVVVARKAGGLYPFDKKAFARLKGEEMQMCAGVALSIAYPPRLVVAKTPDGRWEVVY
jgi:hypothetical protein